MPTKKSPRVTSIEVPSGPAVETRILLIRGEKVMIDSDLADLYGVTTKRLNEQVSRNRRRFPEGFMFRLTKLEKAEVVAICDHLQKLKFSPSLPYAFTERGAVMLASVLNSPTAIDASITVVRAFVRLRSILAAHKELSRKIDELAKSTDSRFKVVFDLVRKHFPPYTKTARIGYRTDRK